MKSLKKTLKIIGLINIIVILGIYFFLKRIQPVPTPVHIEAIQFKSLFPNNDYKETVSKGWRGYKFKGSLRVLCKDIKPGPDTVKDMVKNSFRTFRLKKNLSLYNKGVYILRKKYM